MRRERSPGMEAAILEKVSRMTTLSTRTLVLTKPVCAFIAHCGRRLERGVEIAEAMILFAEVETESGRVFLGCL